MKRDGSPGSLLNHVNLRSFLYSSLRVFTKHFKKLLGMTCGAVIIGVSAEGSGIPWRLHVIFLELKFESLCILGTNVKRHKR